MATKQEEVFETDEVRELVADFQKAMGGLLVIVGVMMITGEFERMAYWLLEVFPFLATIG